MNICPFLKVGVTRREASVQLMETDFDERRNINRRKKWISEGKDPDIEEKSQRKAHLQKRKAIRKEEKHKNKRRKLQEKMVDNPSTSSNL